MNTPKKKSKKITKKLLHKYRLVVTNADNFEVRYALKLNRLKVLLFTLVFAIALVFLTTLLIAFTPLREFIPGYSSSKLKRQALEQSFKVDSLTNAIKAKDQYYASIKKVLIGEVTLDKINKDSILKAANNDIDFQPVQTNSQDSILREKVEKEDRYNLFEDTTNQTNYVLFPPVNGVISEAFNFNDKHYAVDVVVPLNTPIKATADGTVIFAEWTVDTGYVVIIEHSYELISVYKHNSAITKRQGDLVKQGEVIAMSGNEGQLTTGPHLHFELWSKGYPVNPTNFITF